MNGLNHKKFGVEIECYVPGYSRDEAYTVLKAQFRGAGIPIKTTASYLSNYHTDNQNMNDWLISYDSTVNGLHSNMVGVEIVSPPLKGSRGMEQLRKVCKILQSLGAIADSKCGFHVHHEADDTFNTQKMGRFFLKHQDALFAMIKGDRKSNHYCSPLTEFAASRDARALTRAALDRRHALNFEPIQKGHIEFRLHHGTVRFADIANWIVLTQKMMEVSQIGILGPTGWLVRLKAILELGPVDLVELQRLLSNEGMYRTVGELNIITGRYAFITRIEGSDGSVTVMIAKNKTPIDDLIEALNITDLELQTLMHGKYMLRQQGQDADAIIVRAHPKRSR